MITLDELEQALAASKAKSLKHAKPGGDSLAATFAPEPDLRANPELLRRLVAFVRADDAILGHELLRPDTTRPYFHLSTLEAWSAEHTKLMRRKREARALLDVGERRATDRGES